MNIETPRQLGALLRDGRRKAGLTQQELADRIQASLRWVQRAERGSVGTGIGKLLAALAAVGVTLESGGRSSDSAIDVPDVNQIIANALQPARHGGRP
jgi:HTH-type transcriptional regulator/antitoxin HipB